MCFLITCATSSTLPDAEFSGVVAPKNEKDRYSIRYAEFVTPLIKAVQEQSDQITKLQKENNKLNERINKLEHALEHLSKKPTHPNTD